MDIKPNWSRINGFGRLTHRGIIQTIRRLNPSPPPGLKNSLGKRQEGLPCPALALWPLMSQASWVHHPA